MALKFIFNLFKRLLTEFNRSDAQDKYILYKYFLFFKFMTELFFFFKQTRVFWAK